VTTGGGGAAEAMTAHCRVVGDRATSGAWPEVQEPLLHLFSRWDGNGVPGGTGGEALPLAIRLVHLASVAEVYHCKWWRRCRACGRPRAAGGQFDPPRVGGVRRLRPRAAGRAGRGVELGRGDRRACRHTSDPDLGGPDVAPATPAAALAGMCFRGRASSEAMRSWSRVSARPTRTAPKRCVA
jgi:hypothetical protein